MGLDPDIIASITEKGTISLKTLNDYHFIKVEEIAFCEADGSYTTLYLENGKEYLVSKSLYSLP
jgi:two-component system LytT family response regulator